jgi:hypothetical protein
MTNKVPLWIAAHESGHAVALMVMIPATAFHSISLYRSGSGWDGRVSYARRSLLTDFQHAVVACCGPYAEHRVRRLPRSNTDFFMWSHDYSVIDEAICDLEEAGGAPFTHNDVLRQVRRLMRQSWPAVLRVAEALRETRYLTHRRACQIASL